MLKKTISILLALAALGPLVACSTPGTTTQGTTATGATTSQVTTPAGSTVTINLSATNMAFSMSTITVSRGATVVINFTNNDAVGHNFALYNSGSSSGTATGMIFQGTVITGPNKNTTYTFTAPSTPGTYFFRCDVHPTLMTGSFIVT